MKFPKPKRIVNKTLLKAIGARPCCVCSRLPSDGHHLKTRGSGGSDTPDNLISLCRQHHTEIHKVGQSKMLENHPHLSSIFKYANKKGE